MLTIDEKKIKAISWEGKDVKKIATTDGKIIWQKSSLPDGYKECEYIEEQGSNYVYIDTGLKGIFNLEMKFSSRLTSTDCLWCSRIDYQNHSNTLFIVNKQLRFDYQDTAPLSQTVGNLTANTVYTIKNDGQKLYLDGTLIYTSPISLTSCDTPMYLFDSYQTLDIGVTNSSNNAFEGRCYYCKIWEGDTIVRDYVPVYKISSSEYGLFDKVNNKFYGSSNNNKFTGKVKEQ